MAIDSRGFQQIKDQMTGQLGAYSEPNALKLTDAERRAIEQAHQPLKGTRFQVNGHYNYCTLDELQELLFGFARSTAIMDTRQSLSRNSPAVDTDQDPETAQMIYALFKYNVRVPTKALPVKIDFTTIKYGLPASVVEALGTERARDLLRNDLLAFLRPFQGAAALWRTPPEVERHGDEGSIGIYARVHLMLAHEYEVLLPPELRKP